ncbi:MAG: DAHL domain-containing protein [Planctomycetota bacterium]
MRIRTILLLALGALMTSLLVVVRPPSHEAHVRILDSLHRLQTLEAMREQELVATRFGLSMNYDRLAQLAQRIDELRHEVPLDALGLSDTDAARVRALVADVFALADTKSRSTEDFVTANASLVNALRVLPRAVRGLADSPALDADDKQRLEALQGVLYRYSLTRDDALRADGERMLDQLALLAAELPDKEREETERAAFLGGVIVRDQATVDAALRDALALDVDTVLHRATELYVNTHSAHLRRVQRSRWLLLAGSLALLGVVAYTLIAYDRLNASIERKVVERTREVAESREELRSLVETTNAIPWIWDLAEQRLRYIGPQAEEALGPNPKQRLESVLGDLLPDAKQNAGEDLELCVPGDGEHDVSLRVIVGPSEEGEAVQNGFFLDVSEQRRVELELQQAQKLESIGRLAAGIAHEINTPTQFVGDNTSFLRETFEELMPLLRKADRLADSVRAGDGPEALAEELKAEAEEVDLDYLCSEIPRSIEQSLGGIDRVRKIVQSMKEFSHPGVEAMTCIDLNRAIESTITVASNEWKYVAEVETDYDPALPSVPCLPGEFNQVVLNMIVNASHAIADVVGEEGPRGTIRISTRRDGDGVEVRISDTGTGIPESARAKIFDPFFTTKGVGRGTGQGLAIAHGVVVQKHNGALDFETELGKGTTFIIRLPLEQPTEELAEAAA